MTVIILEKYTRFWSHNHKELLFQIQESPWVFQDDGKKKTLERNGQNDYTIQEERKRSECREQRNTNENVSNHVMAARARLPSHPGHWRWTNNTARRSWTWGKDSNHEEGEAMEQASSWATVFRERDFPRSFCKGGTWSDLMEHRLARNGRQSTGNLRGTPLMLSRELWDMAREELHEDKGSFQADSGEPWFSTASSSQTRNPLCSRITERMTRVDPGFMVGDDWQHAAYCSTPVKKSAKLNSTDKSIPRLWTTS